MFDSTRYVVVNKFSDIIPGFKVVITGYLAISKEKRKDLFVVDTVTVDKPNLSMILK